MKQNRREFISTVAAAGAAVPFIQLHKEITRPEEKSRFPLRIFSKPLDSYDFDFICECTLKSGIGGLDLTVRPGGKVEPAEADIKLPELSKQAKKFGLALDMLVTGIVSASDPLTEKVLKAASAIGVTHYRLGYYEFDYKVGVWESLQKHKVSVKEITELNRKYKIHGAYQNHSGSRVGGPVWDLYEILRDLPPEFAGCQYDVRHATVEGASAWLPGMRLLAPHIRNLAIKDFIWVCGDGQPKPVTVPMGEGMVNWDLFFKTVKELNLSGPMTLHVEYPLLSKEEMKLPLSGQQEIIVRKIKKDIDFLKGFLKKYDLV